MRQLREAITLWEIKLKTAEGKDALIIKRALIEMRKDQYIIKNAYRKPIIPNKLVHTSFPIVLEDTTHLLDERGYPIPEGVSLLNPQVCSAILCNYSRLKQDSYDRFDSDLYFLMEAFDEIAEKALKRKPLYYRLVTYKIDSVQNIKIQQLLQEEFGIKHSIEYISCLWRKKIPKLIASAAEDQWLDQYYLEEERGSYKQCSVCGKIKLAHNKYFSKNKTSKDGWYSICKECRKAKKGGV